MSQSPKLLQDKIAIADFKKRAVALHASANNGANALIELGREINQFIDSGLYAVECSTIKEFFKKNFDWSDSYVHRLRRAANISGLAGLLPDAESPEPMTPARALKIARAARVVPQKVNHVQPLITTTPVNKNNSLTPVEVDACGEPITPHALPFWHRRGEVEAVMQVIENLGKSCRERLKEGDPLWSGLPAQGVEMALHNAYHAVKNFLPYALCTACQGHVANGSCEACHNTGMVSQFHFESFSDRLAKQIRDKNRKEQRANA